MATRPISSRVHGVLDYTTGATLAAAPAALGLAGTPAGLILRAAGGGTIAYSLLTRYELGAAKVIPYRGHLGIDAIAAVGLAAAPWLFGTARRGVRHWLPHALFGVFELGAVALSDPTGAGAAVTDGTASAAGSSSPAAPTAATTPTASTPPALPQTSPDPAAPVMPEGAEEALAARGAAARRGVNGGGVGSGAGPGSDPRSGGLQS